MAAGLIALGDDRIAAVIGEPLRLAAVVAEAITLAPVALTRSSRAAFRQAEMKADDLRLELLDDLAVDIVEGLAIDRRHGFCGIDDELLVVSGQPSLPFGVAGGVGSGGL